MNRRKKHQIVQRPKEDSLGIYLDFTPSGFLKKVCFNANSDQEFQILEQALCRLTKRDHFGWIRRLFQRG